MKKGREQEEEAMLLDGDLAVFRVSLSQSSVRMLMDFLKLPWEGQPRGQGVEECCRIPVHQGQ